MVPVAEVGAQPPHVGLGGPDERLHRRLVARVPRGQRQPGPLVHGRDRSRRTPLAGPLVGLLVALLVGAAALPAYAATFSSYRTKVTDLTPTTPGLTATSLENGEAITLSNTSATPVIVEGYQGEPYLKVTAAGVWQNDLSPAVYLNKEQTIGAIPNDANATQAPRWTKVSDGHRAQWHDHRIHWMGATEPPAVAADPGKPHLVATWHIPLRVGATTGEITGTLRYLPAGHWGSYLTYGAIGLGVVIVVAVQLLVVRRRRGGAVSPA